MVVEAGDSGKEVEDLGAAFSGLETGMRSSRSLSLSRIRSSRSLSLSLSLVAIVFLFFLLAFGCRGLFSLSVCQEYSDHY